MQEHDMSWVRTEMVLAQPAPASVTGLGAWVRKNLIASAGDTILTIVGIALVAMILPQIINWAFINAVWTGPDRTVCATVAQGGIQPDGWTGACWAFVNAKFGQFMLGRYPIEERWRPILVAILFVALLVPMLIPKVPRKGLNAVLLFFVLPIVAFVLLVGGMFGLPHVETSLWGGLLVTLSLSFVGIAVSLPLGIVLALGRRSKMPIIKTLCVVFIETVRGIPLITVLFFASVMLPLFLPEGVSFDKFLRALIGVSLFAAAYMAEVVRGGLQAIPKGQYEGADSLGLGYWQKMYFIVMPQALKLVIPGIVNTFIGMFKDTSLVIIISMFDLLGIVKQNFSDANWATAQTARSGLIFAAFVFWLFCFGMSRYSMYTERRLDTGHKR
ncbi:MULTISPECIES: amino acid ABC transporter permease [unclassified Mesorhizobium]|jgi:general L-amino acid transport system permease protein|uniref:amino acid ABC transporter permease n=1 Tax=unclassified Mesorhizobium TaxID=325217 RepID=UPI000FCBC16C|nr:MULTISPECIES: amino acid ABC transporter permease [unclassified Mesorhizobium]RUV09809.1 amino acid ABC transporter permease [Mesorhizobium sp. M7A.T.Ca.TU.009.01.3.1]MCQ8870905.1 amino acid ABC transporter permease [Mesorhizobium sp. LMG17149]RUT83737.1 amino acid ABC transporter permease [Mesorhizobium sp. M7A.T.Ca.US.000.02.1.1]RUT86236.1 amino acid ABC transporter permease [Mesorhizobium sp. M7A.T.Ca.US.000.02.2.1]RUT99500.1 amino acid ABC transporter permease [Mesorhizobium sp. M7A.T.C